MTNIHSKQTRLSLQQSQRRDNENEQGYIGKRLYACCHDDVSTVSMYCCTSITAPTLG